MLQYGRFCVASLALATSMFCGSGALAGEECCGKEGAAKKAVAAPSGCCGGEKVAGDAKKPDACCDGEKGAQTAAAKTDHCDLGACDAKHAASFDAILAKVTAPAPNLSADDAKAVAGAKKTLMSCPAGRAFTAALPTIAESLAALDALHAALEKKDGLAADCRDKEGHCAFCSEAGKDAPEAAMTAMKVSMSSTARARKLADALLPIAATFPLTGETTKPAGFGAESPTAAQLEALAARIDAVSKDLKAGIEAACKMPENEGEKKKLEGAIATLDKLAPSHSPSALHPAHMSLYREMGLASESVAAFGKLFPKFHDEKFVLGLSKNAQNAHKLFLAREKLLTALGGAYAAVKPGECEGGEGAQAKPVSDKPAGCCEGEKAKETAKPKASN